MIDYNNFVGDLKNMINRYVFQLGTSSVIQCINNYITNKYGIDIDINNLDMPSNTKLESIDYFPLYPNGNYDIKLQYQFIQFLGCYIKDIDTDKPYPVKKEYCIICKESPDED